MLARNGWIDPYEPWHERPRKYIPPQPIDVPRWIGTTAGAIVLVAVLLTLLAGINWFEVRLWAFRSAVPVYQIVPHPTVPNRSNAKGLGSLRGPLFHRRTVVTASPSASLSCPSRDDCQLSRSIRTCPLCLLRIRNSPIALHSRHLSRHCSYRCGNCACHRYW